MSLQWADEQQSRGALRRARSFFEDHDRVCRARPCTLFPRKTANATKREEKKKKNPKHQSPTTAHVRFVLHNAITSYTRAGACERPLTVTRRPGDRRAAGARGVRVQEQTVRARWSPSPRSGGGGTRRVKAAAESCALWHWTVHGRGRRAAVARSAAARAYRQCKRPDGVAAAPRRAARARGRTDGRANAVWTWPRFESERARTGDGG